MTTPTARTSHRKTASCFVRGVEVSVWTFTTYEPVAELDGSESYRPRSRDATLIKLHGDRTLWLSVSEHIRLLEALQAVTKELKTGEASPAPSENEEQPTLQDRVWVHRVIEWARLHGYLDVLEQDAAEVLALLGWTGSQSAIRQKLLDDEVRRVHQQEWITDDWDGDARPVDPYGELEGGRYPVSRWLLRRSQEEREARGVSRVWRLDNKPGVTR